MKKEYNFSDSIKNPYIKKLKNRFQSVSKKKLLSISKN